MPLPVISICLPVFNGEDYLEAAVKSALAQTYEDFELVVIDDCSSDSTAEIIASLKRQDKRIQPYRNEVRLGLFQNYNECLKRAQGTYIKPFAHDDLWFPSILEELVRLI